MASEQSRDTAGDTHAAIMAATDRAIRKHGYADLSISTIAAEFGKSKSVLYHHFEDKDELPVTFLEHVVARFSADVAVSEGEDPEAQLRSVIDRLLPPTLDAEERTFQAALFELRAQAPHDEAYRRPFARTDRRLRGAVADQITTGIEQGCFRPIDPEATAQLILSIIYGGMLERVTTADADPAGELRRALDAYIDGYLVTDGTPGGDPTRHR